MPAPSLDPAHRPRPHSDPIEDFKPYFDRQKEEGTRGVVVNGTNAAYYLPEDALLRYLTTDRINTIHAQLYPSQHHAAPIRMYDPNEIRRRYRKVLAILLYTDRGKLLDDFLRDPNSDDAHLPFWEKNGHFPGNDEDFKAFFEAQWKFCVPQMRYGPIYHWDPYQILPFRSKGKLGEGDGGSATLIEIQRSHNKLRSPSIPTEDVAHPRRMSSSTDEASIENPNIFVLKLFHQKRSSREDWLNEATSHVAVRTNSNLTNDRGIIDFYGSFSHGNTFGILLEHAPLGNLEQLFKRDERPQSYQEILDMWRSFFRLLSTLKSLRRMKSPGGWIWICHFDIKPNNILVFRGDSGRRFDYKFKLGDLGSSVQCWVTDEDFPTTPQALQNPGTRTYGAPECCRLDPNSDAFVLPPNYVRPEADLWSYGCVASELATWITRGWGGLKAYREGRTDNHNANWKEPDCFHNGYQVLPWITTHHERLDDELESDLCNATVAALRLIDAGMLQFDPRKRKDPGELGHEAKDMMDAVEKHISSQAPTVSSARFSAISEPKHSGPVPGPISYTLGESKASSTRRVANDRFGHHKKAIAAGAQQIRTPKRSTSVEVADLEVTRNRRDQFYEDPGRAMSSDTNTRICKDQLAKLRHQQRSEPAIAENGIATAYQGPEPWQHVVPSEADAELSMANDRNEPSNAVEAMADSISLTAEPEDLIEQGQNIAQRDPATHSFRDSGLGDSIRKNHSPQSHDVPFLGVTEALLWLYETKSQSLWSKIQKRVDKAHEGDWRQLTHDFEKRDFHFLIDDSHSMSPYWSEVEKCARLLAFCATRFDKDGLDLSFMFSDKTKNTRSYELIATVVNANKPPEIQPGSHQQNQRGNINAVLGTIVRKYIKKIEENKKYVHGPELKPLVLFILTDGLWAPHSDVMEPLTDLVRTLIKYNLPSNQVGVQFIRFGNDKDGAKRLSDLDDSLDRDIVDVEAWSQGNVWKMLLGSINKDFDFAESFNTASDTSGISALVGASQRNSDVPSSPQMAIQHGHPSNGSVDRHDDRSSSSSQAPPSRDGRSRPRGVSHSSQQTHHHQHYPQPFVH